ncbi:MAG: PAS domain S-box protein [Candidatus Thorarchaeota archaeon]
MDFSKNKFIQIIEGIKEGYFEVDLKGNFTFFNDSVCKLIGYSQEELLGLNYKYIADEENRKKVFNGFNSVYITGEPLTDFEYEFKNRAGEKIIGETSVYLKIDSNGNKIGFYGIFRDVTKRKEQEKQFRRELEQLVNLRTHELRDSEEKYSNLFHHSNDAIILHDLEGNIIDVNQRVLEKFGYTRDEILNLNIADLHPTSELELSKKAFEEISKIGFVSFEISFIKKNKKIFFAEVSSSLFDLGGKKVIQGVVRDTTFRIMTEKRLKESEEKYHQLFNKFPYPIGLFDLNGNLIDCNSATGNLLSTHVIDDIIGKNYREFWVYDKRDKPLVSLFNDIFTKIISTGETINFEFPIHRTIGELIWSYATASKIKIGMNEFIQIILMDISTRKETQQRLRESEEKYRNLVENAHEGVWAVDENDNTIFVNPKLCEMLGYTREEIMSKNLHYFLESPMIDLINSYRERRGQGLKDTYELEFIKKDGTILSTIINASPILKENGEFKGSFAFITDITKRKIAEQKLKESEARYRNLIESVPFSIALIDQQGKLIYCNPALEKLINYSRDELIGIEFKNLPAINPEYVPLLLRRFQRVLKGEILSPLDMELYKKDGSSIWIRYQSTLVKLGEKILLQTVINDITEQRKADLLIEEELVKLKDLDQIRKDLISRVSHELKTPLVSVCGAAELLLDLYIDQFKGDTKELIEMIEKGGKRLKYLVDNLVDITRIEYRKFELDMNTNNFSQIIRDCANELMFLIKKRKLILELDLIDDLYLKFDRIRIEQVILNLLSNAIKNTPPNGKITVRCLKKDDSVELLVQDTGIGLTKGEIDKLFIRFGKIERYGNGLEYIDIQGTGLGLFISKEIIDLHKGQIWAISRGRNKGSTFTIKLPM